MAPLGNTKEDDYYRNDSMKYCRHEEKKRKRRGKVGCEAGFKYSSSMVRALLRTSQNLQSGWAPAVALHFGFWSLEMETCAKNSQCQSTAFVKEMHPFSPSHFYHGAVERF